MKLGVPRGRGSRTLSNASRITPNRANFPACILSLDIDSIYPSEVQDEGYAVDHAGGAIYQDHYSATVTSNGSFKTSGDVWGTVGHYQHEASNMELLSPSLGTKNLLLLWVGNSGAQFHGIFPPDPFVGPGITCPDGDVVQIDASNYVTMPTLDPAPDAAVRACCTFFNRSAASDIAGCLSYMSDGTTTTPVGEGIKTGATNMRTADWGQISSRLVLDNGAADLTQGYLYGFYLFGFSNSKYMDIATLGPMLDWMARNPTKGLHPYFRGLT